MSPELFNPRKFGLQDSRPTKRSDCYALGMVIYEVLRGKAPFCWYHDYNVVAMVLEGERPGRPRGVEGMWFKDGVWNTLECCWKPIPGDRPRIGHVLECLETVSRTWTSPSPEMLASPATTDPVTHGPDSSNEESTDGSETPSSSQVDSSQPSQKPQPTGDPNENNI